MSPWWPILGLLSWCPIHKSRLFNSYGDWASLDFIYRCLIFRWFAETLSHDMSTRIVTPAMAARPHAPCNTNTSCPSMVISPARKDRKTISCIPWVKKCHVDLWHIWNVPKKFSCLTFEILHFSKQWSTIYKKTIENKKELCQNLLAWLAVWLALGHQGKGYVEPWCVNPYRASHSDSECRDPFHKGFMSS